MVGGRPAALLMLPVHLGPGHVPRCLQPRAASVRSDHILPDPQQKGKKVHGGQGPTMPDSPGRGLLTPGDTRGPGLRRASPRGWDTAFPRASVCGLLARGRHFHTFSPDLQEKEAVWAGAPWHWGRLTPRRSAVYREVVGTWRHEGSWGLKEGHTLTCLGAPEHS